MKNICFRCHSFMELDEKQIWRKCNCGVRVFVKEIITLHDVLTSSGKYPDREINKECTMEVRENAQILCNRINQLLNNLGVTSCKVSSGFRTSEANSALPNSAKRSLHMIGKAVDLVDDSKHTLGHLISGKPELLKKYDLWLEDLASTNSWVHLDIGVRTDRDSRTFKP